MRQVVFAIALIAAGTAGAQDLRRLEPQPVAPPAAPIDQPAASEVAADTVLLPALNGLVFITHPSQLSDSADFSGQSDEAADSRVDTRRVAPLQAPEFRAALRPWLSRPLSERDLQRLLALVSVWYSANDRPFVHVSVPSQPIDDGVLRVLVVEGRLGEVSVAGNRWFEADDYRRALRIAEGEPLSRRELEGALDWISRSNPFRSATVTARPGASFGRTDLRLDVRERKPVRLYAGVNNSGSETTDEERILLGANLGNLFGAGHQLNAQLSASPDFNKSLGLSVGYTAPLTARRHLIHVSGAWSRIRADLPQPFDSEGNAWQLLAGYEVLLMPLADLSHSIQLGVEFKRSDNNLEFGGLPVTDNVTDVVQAALTWQGTLPDRFGRTDMALRMVAAPGDVTRRNDDAAFDASRWGASADYLYGRLDLARHTTLPADFGWRLLFAWQQSSDNLIGSEQLGLSGSHGVRGYSENYLYADEGVLLRNELLLPPLQLLGDTDQLQLFLFSDYGRGNSNRRLPGEAREMSLRSHGVGARYALGQSLSAGLEYGRQEKAMVGRSRGQELHFHLLVSY